MKYYPVNINTNTTYIQHKALIPEAVDQSTKS